MKTQYDAQAIGEAFAAILQDDVQFVSDSGRVDLEGMRNYGIYLVRLAAALSFMKDIQTFLNAIDEPTQYQADDKAFDKMRAFIEEQPFE